MNIDIYKSTTTPGRAFVVKSGSDISTLPEQVESLPVKTMDIRPGDQLVGLSSDKAINGISDKGFYATDVLVLINENT